MDLWTERGYLAVSEVDLLSRVVFQGFKNLADVGIPLQRLSLLVGPNGVGKSSVLDALYTIGQMARVPTGEVLHPRRAFAALQEMPERLVTKGEGAFSFALERDGVSIWRLSWKAGVKNEQAWELGPDGGTTTPIRRLDHLPGARFPDEVRGAVLLRLNHRDCATATVPQSEVPSLEPSGHGLPSVLQYLAGAEPERLREIESDLGLIVHGAKGIRVRPERVPASQRSAGTDRPMDWVMGAQVHVVMEKGELAADMLSEGTLITLALLTALHSPVAPPRLLLLDDLGASLHPGALGALIAAIRRILARQPDLQIVATSHSPDLIDLVEAEEVVVMKRGPNGHAVAKRLSEHPEWTSRWKGQIRPGEMWGAFGEDWIL